MTRAEWIKIFNNIEYPADEIWNMRKHLDEEDGDYWDSYDKTDCKHYKTNLDKLAEVYVIDEELKQDD